MPARLTLFLPRQAALVRTLREDSDSVVGRDEGCDVVADDERISRRHALFRFDGQWSVTDLESKNGTLVDGRPVARATPLPSGAWLSLGGVLTRFETITPAEESAAHERQLARWRSSLELRRGLSPALGLEPLLLAVLDSVLQLAETQRGFVLLRDPEGELEVRAARHVAAGELLAAGFGGSVGAVTRVLERQRAVALGDAVADPTLGARESVLAGGIRALVCLPLKAMGNLLGVVYSDSDQPGKCFDELDLEILEALADHAALAISVARLDEELEGLAARLAEATPGTEGTAADLAAEVERARRSWIPAEELPWPRRPSPATGALPTWSAILEAHEGLHGGTDG